MSHRLHLLRTLYKLLAHTFSRHRLLRFAAASRISYFWSCKPHLYEHVVACFQQRQQGTADGGHATGQGQGCLSACAMQTHNVQAHTTLN
jgi:hypothetical protein